MINDESQPESYQMSVYYNHGGVDHFDAVLHRTIPNVPMFEILTADELWSIIPFDSIKKISFDNKFTESRKVKE